MPLLTISSLLQLILQYGPTIVPLLQKLYADIASGKGNQEVTQADLDALAKLSTQTSADIYLRLGITPPSAS